MAQRTRFYCSPECVWLDESNPGRYVGDRNYLDRYDGWEASEVIQDLGFVRDDGETLIGQPHLRDERRWTLSDIRAHDLHLRSPNIRVARELGLPSGDWSDSGLRVRFEPLGEEIDCGPEETVLDAAFRNGYSFGHGCREGQCSACKCFLLEGDVELERYSSFALSDAERGGGYALMCRALPESDLVIELLHYDPDNYRLEHAIGEREGTVVEVRELTHNIVRLTLAADLEFVAGQYIDLHVPGGNGARRSFSIANLPGEGTLELIIKRYPGGRLSSLLGDEIACDSHLRFSGPYGAFHLRRSARPILMIAGGSGMAPVLALLRQLAREGCERPVRFFYGARAERDLFALDEIAALGERLDDFRFVPVTGRFVHEAIDDELTDPDVYMCGPPPMLDAAQATLTERGVDPARIFQDRFTTSADAPAQRAVSEREFAWFKPAGRRATLYEDVTVDTQPSIHRHLTRGWPLHFEDGRGTWDDGSTALECDDWFAFRDPGEQWERTFYQRGAAAERQLETAVSQGLFDDFAAPWVQLLREHLQVAAFVEHGLWFALATAARDCLSDTVATCVCLQAACKQRSAQAIVLYAMDLERALGGEFSIESARKTFIRNERWQPTRAYLEQLAATRDWGEVIVAANLCFEPAVGTLLRRELGTRSAAACGDTVTPVLAAAATQEWEWSRAWTVELVRFLISDNRELIEDWLADWTPRAGEALAALAPGARADDVVTEALEQKSPGRPPQARAGKPGRLASAVRTSTDASEFDYVGIVMAKSAEGDAVARVLAGHHRVEVIEQPSFWEIRARRRLVISFAELSAELGYEISAYSIQREMSTHYGRMVVGDDELTLFSDPADAMAHLMS